MTHKAINKPWDESEILKVRQIMTSNDHINPTERIKLAAQQVDRTFNSVQFKWYTHIKKIRAASTDVITDDTPQPLISTKQAKVYIDMKGQAFLSKQEAVDSNINYILIEMENTDNLYTWMLDNKDKVNFILNSKTED